MDGVPIVCDYGSGFSKVGFAGSKDPLNVFPTILGTFRHDIWHYSFYRVLHSNPKLQPLMLTEPPLNPVSVKATTSQILFETFRVPALHLANQGVLSMYSSGQTSGTTIESGEGMTYFVPVIDGCPLHHSTTKLDVAGQDLTFYLMRLLDRGNLLLGTADRECVRDMKEKCCYVAEDLDKEKEDTLASRDQQAFQLPDGREVSLAREAFLCPEALFQTSLLGRNSQGIHMFTIRSITSCDRNFWNALLGHIVLSGGTSCLPGLKQRLQNEVVRLACSYFTVKVAISPYAKTGAWTGGSILCSLSTFKDMWVTRSEYEEMGASIVSRRSF
ncbi:actin isoform X1 [Perognathus longimembris pacificus]|uniref:actin isoform X1 n=1 Tax=Perognathus longimembris pacificus TaxID=214514 RepID=UPI002018D47B|nr:actin isoform X1 [Perognathus longimembris pacificus]